MVVADLIHSSFSSFFNFEPEPKLVRYFFEPFFNDNTARQLLHLFTLLHLSIQNTTRLQSEIMQSAKTSNQSDPSFLPLEENLPKTKSSEFLNRSESNDEEEKQKFQRPRWLPKVSAKKAIAAAVGILAVIVIFESFFVNPQDRLIQPDFSDKFLSWVQSHPQLGLWAISIVIAVGVVTMVPVGTPLTIGCGYIYRGLYGWKLGMFVATAVSMMGSCLGAVSCFLIGRYLMRDTVQTWARKYPLFDAIDVGMFHRALTILSKSTFLCS